MRKLLMVLVAGFIFMGGLAYAETKIAVFDMQRALEESAAGKDAVESMKKEYQSYRKT